MDCRTCQPTLIDLLYGELATDAAEAARVHLRDCASCRSAYEKLAAGLRVARTLELVDPPAHVEHKLLELAQARALTIAEQRAAAAPAVLSPWRIAIDFVRRFAMASQVKMVAASALVVTVVLLALPRFWRESQVPMVATVSPAQQAAEEAAPSDGVQPAERLGLKMDSQSGRIRSTEGEMAEQAAARTAQPAPAAVPEADLRDEKKSVAPRATVAESRAQRSRENLAQAKEESLAKGKQREGAEDELLNGYRDRSPSAQAEFAPSPYRADDKDAPAGRAPAKAKAGSEPVLDSAASSIANRSANGAGASSSTVGAPYPAAKPAGPATTSASRAPSAERTFAPAPAAPPAKTSLAGQLQAARALAQRDGCAAALSSYERIVAAGGATLEAGEALLDMAHCRISLGQPAIARALLERAARIPASAPRARALLSGNAAQSTQSAPAAAEPPP